MKRTLVIAAMLLVSIGTAMAEDATPLAAMGRLPVKEITVFKDGHALVLHEGKMPVEAGGDIVMDYLPTPVLGTFWPYSMDKNVKLSAVTASQRKISLETTALTQREMIEANIGAEVIVNGTYHAVILGIPTRSSQELESLALPGTGQMLPIKADVVLLKTDAGVRPVPFANIQEITFKGEQKKMVSSEQFRNVLRLKMDWGDKKPEKTAGVGMMYLQKGFRWIPSYKITIDGKGNAEIKLQATLINELTDLEDATAHLVIGVPNFAFKDTIDPMAMQQAVAQLSQYFRGDSSTQYGLSNGIMTQAAGASARMSEARAEQPTPVADLGPEVAGSGQNEDLFIFTVKHVTLKKGQRMVLPVTEFKLAYKDVFVLDVPFSPPPEVWRGFAPNQQSDMAKLLNAPKAMHNLRLANTSDYPLTTAPAMIVREDRVLGQGMMTFTPKGGSVDLPITAAVDITVKKSEKETGRNPEAGTWERLKFAKVDLAGTLKLTNYRAATVDIEVTRYVLGAAAEASNDGVVEMVNSFEDSSFLPATSTTNAYPYWWGWYSWPHWWYHYNTIGRIKWNVHLEPGKSAELKYTWNYYWQ